MLWVSTTILIWHISFTTTYASAIWFSHTTASNLSKQNGWRKPQLFKSKARCYTLPWFSKNPHTDILRTYQANLQKQKFRLQVFNFYCKRFISSHILYYLYSLNCTLCTLQCAWGNTSKLRICAKPGCSFLLQRRLQHCHFQTKCCREKHYDQKNLIQVKANSMSCCL